MLGYRVWVGARSPRSPKFRSVSEITFLTTHCSASCAAESKLVFFLPGVRRCRASLILRDPKMTNPPLVPEFSRPPLPLPSLLRHDSQELFLQTEAGLRVRSGPVAASGPARLRPLLFPETFLRGFSAATHPGTATAIDRRKRPRHCWYTAPFRCQRDWRPHLQGIGGQPFSCGLHPLRCPYCRPPHRKIGISGGVSEPSVVPALCATP